MNYLHDPDADLDYQWDWSAWLGADTISSATVDVSAGLTLGTVSNTTTAVTAWISGGTAGTTQTATCHVVTAAGREDDRTIHLIVQER